MLPSAKANAYYTYILKYSIHLFLKTELLEIGECIICVKYGNRKFCHLPGETKIKICSKPQGAEK